MISFIIPTLNESKAIEATLKCLKGYGGECEIIVSDGGSADDTVAIAKKYTDKVVIYQGDKRQNIAMGRNAGAKIAKGDFLVFLDADVTIFDIDNFFKEAFANFELRKKLVALTVGYKILPENETLADKVVFKILSLNFVLFNNYLHVGVSGGEFQMIKRESFEYVKGFDEKLVAAEDGDMFARLGKIGRTRCDINLSIYHSGRREHAIGWPRLIHQWMGNYISVQLFRRSISTEWEQIR
ncbi:MAG: glycosyltransferase [Patescibacteria group bacterium]